jgi:hypothetical protein
LAREHTDVALAALVQVARDGESESARVAAANALLDRGYGKASQLVEHTGKDGKPIQTEDVTEANLIEKARRLGIDPTTIGL